MRYEEGAAGGKKLRESHHIDGSVTLEALLKIYLLLVFILRTLKRWEAINNMVKRRFSKIFYTCPTVPETEFVMGSLNTYLYIGQRISLCLLPTSHELWTNLIFKPLSHIIEEISKFPKQVLEYFRSRHCRTLMDQVPRQVGKWTSLR